MSKPRYMPHDKTVDELINEKLFDTVDIVHIERFKMAMRYAQSIESVSVFEMDQEVNGKQIITNLTLDITVGSEVFYIFLIVEGSVLLKHLINFSVSTESEQYVNNFFR